MKPNEIKLSVLIPAFNESKTILRVLQSLDATKLLHEVIVIDDASTDTTQKILHAFKPKSFTLHIIKHETNRGKGAAIQTGLEKVTGNYVLIQDADLEYDPVDIPTLLDPIKRGRATVVYGNRLTGVHTNMFFWHLVGNKFLNFVVNILFNSILMDMETGYKIIPTDLMRSIKLSSNSFSIEPEITCKLLSRGEKIVEVPISYAARTYAEGKKISWKDGFGALATIVKIRLRNNRAAGEVPIWSIEPMLRNLRMRPVVQHIKPAEVLVDVGCDDPPLTLLAFEEKFKKLIGLDIIVKDRTEGKISLKYADFDTTIPLEDNLADTITMLAVLEHLDHPEAIVRELYRIAKPGGQVLLTVPAPPVKPILEFLAKIRVVRPDMIAQHKNYFTKKRLQKIFTDAGFRQVEVKNFQIVFNTFLHAVK
jgi:glycosyltransferase involved in cell wall biosynthesis